MSDINKQTIQALVNELYNKWGCDPMDYADDTATGNQARLDAAIIEWLEMHLNA